ncbi:hypothetical protein G6F68_014663 [Rhizopus microsporus]|nr:hypothetical protein G6F68_014663 [Rhizopus microsporus]
MEADVGGTGLGEIRNDAVHRLDHQVHVDRRGHAVLAQGRADHRADGQVRHVVVVHHVEVDPVGAGGEDVVDFLAEASEVGGQDGRGNEAVGHGRALQRGERGSALAQGLDAVVRGIDPPRLLLGLLLQLGGGAAKLVGVVLGDQLAIGALDLCIGGLRGRPPRQTADWAGTAGRRR